MQVLIVEDQPNDLRIAAGAAKASGFSGVEARTSAETAKAFLQDAIEGRLAMPDAIVLDLDLGHDSGFEVLRFWHSNPRLRSIPLIVWTVLGEQYREICRLFQVRAFLYKGEDISVLQTALRGLTRASA
ncbi:MAG TPA: response regulator [Acidobacteriaceae bacterium]|nr:response regulator [Acidobacteriaceae bacterium]